MRAAIVFATALLLSFAGVARAETIAVVHATAYTMTAPGPTRNATIVATGGRITAVGVGLGAPPGAHVIDAQGRRVTPGLMNAGTELGLVEVSSVADTSDAAVTSGPLGASFDVQYAINPNSTLLAQARADGLTRAGVYPSRSANAPFDGQGLVLALSDGPDLVDRPRVMMFVEIGGMAAARAGGSRSAAWELLRNALQEARAFRNQPKTVGPRDQLLNHLDAQALQPVLAGRMPLAVIAGRESDIRQAIRLADDFSVRVVIFGGAEAWRAATDLAAHHIAVVLNPFDDMPATFDEMGARLDNASLLQKAGVMIAFEVPGIHFSHDAGEGLREAAGLAVSNGLPWIEGLKAVTTNAAKIWGIADRYGALAPGRDADLVIWDGDPLEPASEPTTVIVRGRPVSLVTRQKLLSERYSPRCKPDGLPAGYH